MIDYLRECANCPSYKWPQLDNYDLYKRCSGCKIFHYCSKECQTEHWLKVHRFHCKYFSREKEKKGSRHDSNKCKFCLNEVKMGSKALKSPNVSVLGCPWRKDIVLGLPFRIGVDSFAPSAEVLGEMTGVFPSKMEHTLYSMLRILYKIIHIKKYKSYGLPEVRSKLQQEIDKLRMFIRHKYCF